MNEIEEPWLNMVREGNGSPTVTRNNWNSRSRQSTPPRPVKCWAFLKGKTIPEDGSWIEIIGRAGTKAELQQLHNQLTGGKLSEKGQARALALGNASRSRNLRPDVDRAGVAEFINSKNSEVKVAALGLAGTWKGWVRSLATNQAGRCRGHGDECSAGRNQRHPRDRRCRAKCAASAWPSATPRRQHGRGCTGDD